MDLHAVECFKEWLWYSRSNKSSWSSELSELVDRKNTIANKLRFRRREVGEHKTGTIAQENLVAEMNSLEVLGLSWGG